MQMSALHDLTILCSFESDKSVLTHLVSLEVVPLIHGGPSIKGKIRAILSSFRSSLQIIAELRRPNSCQKKNSFAENYFLLSLLLRFRHAAPDYFYVILMEISVSFVSFEGRPLSFIFDFPLRKSKCASVENDGHVTRISDAKMIRTVARFNFVVF